MDVIKHLTEVEQTLKKEKIDIPDCVIQLEMVGEVACFIRIKKKKMKVFEGVNEVTTCSIQTDPKFSKFTLTGEPEFFIRFFPYLKKALIKVGKKSKIKKKSRKISNP